MKFSDTPPADDPDPFAVRNSIDELVDQFELDWHAAKFAEIPTLLDRVLMAAREELLAELIHVDAEHSASLNERRSKEFYLSQLSAYSTVIESLPLDTLTTTDQRSRLGPSAGDVFASRFELHALLGSGAMGEVWRAFDRQLKRHVALKLANRGELTDHERQRFLREAKAGAQLQHPNIVRVHDTDIEGTIPYIVADYIAGKNLKTWINENDVPFNKAAEICVILAKALDHAHEKGVIHRDVKPANVLVDEDGHLFLTDFGLAKWGDDSKDLTISGQLLGTAAYMSPEQARGHSSSVDRRSDVYSLGVILYELITGQRPHSGDFISIAYDIRHTTPIPPRAHRPKLPSDLQTICLKALEKDPNRRYQTCRELAADLERFLCGEPILARPKSAFTKGLEWLNRHRAVSAAAMLVALLGGALSTIGKLQDKNRELLGIQTVRITTVPAGARIAFVPLDRNSGLPSRTDRYLASGTTPLDFDLTHGDYLIAAVLRDGRFHEVIRHVPSPSELDALPEGYNHRFYKRLADGVISVPKITIPDAQVAEGMTLVRGNKDFVAGVKGSTMLPQHAQPVSDLFVDNHEFTLGDLKKIFDRLSLRFKQSSLSDTDAITVTFDQAVYYAEVTGKRLPTEFEYEFVATNRGQSAYPWGDSPPGSIVQASFGNNKPDFDHLRMAPSVVGLCTGLAEWTFSYFVPYPPVVLSPELTNSFNLRVVRGDSDRQSQQIKGDASGDPRGRRGVDRIFLNADIGFRCVRSARPIVGYSDFD